MRGAGTCGTPAASRWQPGRCGRAREARVSPRSRSLPVGREGPRWSRGTRPSAQINHKAHPERSRSPPRRAAICLCCSPAPARCGGAGAEDEEGARSPVALPSQQGGGNTSCGTGCRERPSRPPPAPTYLRSPPGTRRPLPLLCMPAPAAPSRGSAPARPLGARRSQARLSPSPRQRRARLGRGTGPRAPPRAG